MKSIVLIATTLSLIVGLAPPASAGQLEEGFRHPPEETKPWCYWYWLDGDITKDGITKDLEMMARVGIKRAMIGNVSFKPGPVKMFSPEWYALTRHALSEANRLSLELMSFNAPGWSQSGGPWIKPEQSMRRVSWQEYPARGGKFSQRVRPVGVAASQDIAVLAVPRLDAVSIVGQARSATAKGDEPSLAGASWIWHPAEAGPTRAPAATRYFKRVVEVDPATLASARVRLTADNSYVLKVNDREVLRDDTWEDAETTSIQPYLQPGSSTIAIEVTNSEESPAGLIAVVELKEKAGKVRTVHTDQAWLASKDQSKDWVAARRLGPMRMAPWRLNAARPKQPTGVLYFASAKPFAARGLVVHGKARGKLYAVREGQRELVADIHAAGGNPKTDFLPSGVETFSFADVTAREFEFEPNPRCRVELTSAPTVAQVVEKQLGRVHPTPSPSWQSYVFPDTVEPAEPASIIQRDQIIDLTDKLQADGTLDCTLPEGDWTVIHFGMVSTGKKNHPAPPEATGLEVDKMNRRHVEHHFESMFGKLLADMSPAERAVFKGITIDSYEVGAQNWTDGFASVFQQRHGYDPIPMLPVMTGRVVDSAKTSDQFLWDLRRNVADMIARQYVGGLRDIAHQHNLSLWCENYGHWGFPGEFLQYGGASDEIGGEFWIGGTLGNIECRAASSAGHIYGKRRVYAEAYTSRLNLGHHPYRFKADGDRMFCQGINHFVLHVYAHQPRDGVPGKNPWFGTAFHRNTPWFNHSRDWVKYLQRCHYMLQQGEPVADVAVYIGDFAPQMTGPPNPVPAGYDYDYVGSDAILRKLQVVDGKWVVHDENDPTRIAARWKILAMPKGLKHIRPEVRARLEALQQAGGKIVDGVPVSADVLRDAGVMPIVSEASCPLRWKARRLDDGMLFFLCDFQRTGTFEATLRVGGKAPELFNPVSGEIKKLARFRRTEGGTRIAIDVPDRSDSFFLVFRDEPSQPSVVSASAAPSDLDLFYDDNGRLAVETTGAGSWTLKLSDGSQRTLTTGQPRSFAIAGPWRTVEERDAGFTLVRETRFDLPADFGEDRRVYLDLGDVSVMAKVTLNGKTFDTLWKPPFKLNVSDAVKPGNNELRVLVTSTSEGTPGFGPKVRLQSIVRAAVPAGGRGELSVHGSVTGAGR